MKLRSILHRAIAGACPRRLAGLWLLFVVALIAGCLTDEEISRNEFAARVARYPAIPADDRERLQHGEVRPGDTQEMVWVARGDPGRRSSRIAAGQTNDVWLYFQAIRAMDPSFSAYSYAQPVFRPGGWMVWSHGPVWFADEMTRDVEILRVEFASNRVVAVEAPHSPNKPQP